jgi:hypothetical protein
VCEAILVQHEGESTRGKGGNNKQHANKLSAVKRKRGDPNFSNQEKGNNQQREQTRDKPRQHRQRGKGKGKKKQGHSHNTEETSHIANVASIAVPSTSTIAQISPARLSRRTATAAPAKERTPGPYKSLNNALDRADHIGVKATIETTKMLEQRIVDQYMDGPWSKSTNYLSDDEGSDIVDMSVAPPSQELINDPVSSPIKADNDDSESNDWAEQLRAQSPGYKPLDWGSDPEDNEVCVHLLSHFPSTHKPIESRQPLKR